MKKLLTVIVFLVSSICLKAQTYPNSWNGSFDNNDLEIEMDFQNGHITYYFTKHFNNSGCQWWLQNSTNVMNVKIRQSGVPWTVIATGVTGPTGPISDYLTPVAGVTVAANGMYEIMPGGLVENVYQITFTNLDPKYFTGLNNYEVYGYWNASNQGCGGIGFKSATKVINFAGPSNVSNPNTDTYCDRVRINWTNPNTWAKRRTRIFRDGNLIYEAPSNFTAYDDYGATPGVAHNYEVQSVMLWGTGRVFENSKISVSGTRYPLPESPQNVYVDQVNCNGALEINWGWSATTNPDRFIIQRSPDNTFSTGVVQHQTSGSDRTYRDLNTQIGQNYYWRVLAQDDCPIPGGSSTANGSWSTVIQQAGLGVPAAPSAIGIQIDTTGKKVTVNWTDNSGMEDGFKVVRQSSTGQVEFDVAENATSYVDNSASTCETYTYRVKSYNTCKSTGVLSTSSASGYIPTDLGTVFDSTSQKIEATDGEFGDRVDLKWNTSNNQIDFWNIKRINPQTDDTVQIASLSGRVSVFSDQTANANTLYKYLIQGETDCAGLTEFSNTSEDFGFRLSFGTVNGQVTYTGGVAVEGVKVTAEPSAGMSGHSGIFNGTSSHATVNHDTELKLDTFSIQSYLRLPSFAGSYGIVSKSSSATEGFELKIANSMLELRLGTQTFSTSIGAMNTSSWFSTSVTVGVDSVFLYLNDTLGGAFVHNGTYVGDTTANLLIGKLSSGSFFNGNIDELRIFNRRLSEVEVQRSFDVFINPSMNGLVGYWRFDEGFGNTAYDYSKTILTPNKNHAQLSIVSFSNLKPSNTQLSAGAYTDKLGSYFIPFIPYQGSGDNFIITPTFGTHTFSPATTTLLIGTGSTNYTGQDFTDNSSFAVTGQVKYQNTNCFVKKARLLIDGEVVIRNGQVVETDNQGQFSMQVPIGPHVVSVEKTSHDFSAGRFPPSGAHDFQAPVSGIEFVDSTLVKVVGRVAGGGIQEDLQPALSLGKNNIGQAEIPFRTQQGNGCLVDTALTDANTGEYIIELPPMNYQIPDFSILSNLGIQFDNNDLLEISTVPPVQTSIDSVFTDSLGYKRLVRVDSAHYQKQRDFIHYVAPTLDVLAADSSRNYGADTLTFESGGNQIEIPSSAVPSTSYPHPFFYENENYDWLISAFEIYENKDNPSAIKIDSVPMVEGKILIQNSLANVERKEFEYAFSDSSLFSGVQAYSFSAGQANTSTDALDPSKNFTKTCEITLLPKNGNALSWQPNNETFRGVIFGARALGNSFSTAGPDVVTMILRDPPGTESTSSWTSGESFTSVRSWENASGVGADLNKIVNVGTKFTVGVGYETETELKSSTRLNLKTEVNVSDQGEIVETQTREVSLSTGGNEEYVGADADLFFGRAMNMDFGLSQILTMVDTSTCGSNAECYGGVISHNGKGFKLGTTNSMFAIPKGYETEFVFTQAGIENQVIPRLENLRNQLLTADPRYSSFLPASNADYGKSNDDPTLTSPTPDPEYNSVVDSLGESYHFSGYRVVDTLYQDTVATSPSVVVVPKQMKMVLGIDSVWWYNKQIRLWEEALAANEKAKVQANVPERNISYQGGSSISYTESTVRSESSTTVVNFNLETGLILKMGGEVSGTGVEVEQGVSLNYSHSSTFGTTQEQSTTFEYTLSDPDGDDDFSVDVFEPSDGFGPIFKTRGGQTSCPYQGESVTKYYQKGTVLDKATIQLEQPRITASPANVFNVPADGQANITLSLINDGLEDAVYGFKVLEPTNPNGAILKIDGISPNRSFPVPAQTSITKTLSVQKGPNHIAYDSIALVFHSLCQYAFGTANYDDIADTVYVSINFLPSCTEVELQAPQNQFVANNSYSNTLPVVVSGYDINYGGLEKIQLQYKPSNQASWVPLPTEWFKDTVDIESRYPNHSDPQLIPRNQSYITYQLAMDQLIDQDYDLRAVSTCQIPFNPEHSEYSDVISGVFDRVNPHAFGTPSPADGVLDPNDDISIQFNEDIEAGSLTPSNFQITGVLNGGDLRHDKAINFDGGTGFLEIANGYDFTSGDFTIEFWAKRRSLGTEQYLISQGTGSNNNFSILFNTNNKLELRAGNFSTESSFTLNDTANWHHYSISYDRSNLTLEIIDRFASNSTSSTDNNYFHAYQSGGKTYIGKNALSGADYFDGSMHELRIWNRFLSNAQISSRMGIRLNGREAGLIGYWPMDEGRGPIARDVSRFRHAEMKAEWELNPKSTAINLDGTSQYVSVDSAGTLAATSEMDLSIEFWFKTSGGQTQTLLSNGSGRFVTTDVNQNGWNIEMNPQNEIWVKNDSVAFKAVEQDFGDNNWHHFALVVNRLANTTVYIDGIQQNSMISSNFNGFSGAKMMIGSRYYLNGVVENVDQFFNGSIDEVRIWNKALIRENIELNMYNRLKGDEFGLLAYYPFEDYQEVLGVPLLSPALENESTNGNQPSRLDAVAQNGPVYSTETPAIALQRPVEKVNFSWSVNGDKIVITPNDPPARIENVTLNVSVKDVRDLHGNLMQSPKTWIAFINKNQVLWQDQEKNLSKEFNDTMTFSSKVINSGGEVKTFTISNIPPWLSVSPSSGSIQPQSSQDIQFTVNPAINIGDYSVDLLLATNFGYNEKLLVNLEVRKTAPDFSFNRNLYSKSMSVIGQIAINDIVRVNDEDILVAYSGNQIRGKAQLQYVSGLDRYIAFLDIFSNQTTDSIQFKVWNAMSGELHEDVTPEIQFVENSLVGSLLSPQLFDAIDKIAMPIHLNKGWNWVSFPLEERKMRSLSTFLGEVSFSNGDQIKTIGHNTFATYGGSSYGWSGNLSRDGLTNNKSYLIYINNSDTIDYRGLAMDPDTVPIEVVSGWNRVGFISTKNMDVNTALANYNAQDGDIIKSQDNFAVYLSSLGWLGSLTALKPSKGYLINSAIGDTFTYPRNVLFRMKGKVYQEQLSESLVDGKSLKPEAFEGNTNLIVKVNTCEEIIKDTAWALAAFNGEELRGFSNHSIVKEGLQPAYYLTVFGEAKEQFDLLLYNKVSKEKLLLSAKADFKNNVLQGSPQEPINIDLEITQDCERFKIGSEKPALSEGNAYPNPFTNSLTIQLPKDVGTNGIIKIIDVFGKTMYKTQVGDRVNIHLDGSVISNWSSGVYYLEIRDQEFEKVEKLIKIK